MEALQDNDCFEHFAEESHELLHCKPAGRKHQFEVSVKDAMFDEFVSQLSQHARLFGFCMKLPRLQMIAQELFSEVAIEFDSDIEIPSLRYLVFRVRGEGDPRRLADLRLEWYKKTDSILGRDCDLVRLKILV